MAAAGLLHFQVNTDFDMVEDKMMHGRYLLAVNNQPQPLQSVSAITSRISEVWPEPPPDRHIHVFVSKPVATGEFFFSPNTYAIW